MGAGLLGRNQLLSLEHLSLRKAGGNAIYRS
jgi:hypothetical protein